MPDGAVYEGQFKDGKKHGVAKCAHDLRRNAAKDVLQSRNNLNSIFPGIIWLAPSTLLEGTHTQMAQCTKASTKRHISELNRK